MPKTTPTQEPEPNVFQEADKRLVSPQDTTIATEYELRIPPAHRGRYRRASTGRSRKAAIRAFCLECVGWSSKEVKLCTSPGCPLFKYRITG